MITQSRLRALLSYNPDTSRPQIRVDGKLYLASRLAFLYMLGRWPKNDVDHRDVNSKNNRWANLREATSAQNATNTLKRRDNKSGYKGVVWHKATQKWAASIRKDRKRQHLGLFSCPEAAHVAYAAAAEKLHRKFANCG